MLEVATFPLDLMKKMDKSVEVTFEELYMNKDIAGMNRLIMEKVPLSLTVGKEWFPTQDTTKIIKHVRSRYDLFYQSINLLDESFVRLVNLLSNRVKIKGLTQHRFYEGMIGTKGREVFVKNGELGVYVYLKELKLSIMVKPKNLIDPDWEIDI